MVSGLPGRARRDPLRLDLMPGSTDDDDPDELGRLRAELPNGGARVIDRAEAPQQESLELGAEEAAPVLLNRSETARTAQSPAVRSRKTEPSLGAPERGARSASEATEATEATEETPAPEPAAEKDSAPAPAAAPRGRRGKVADVIMPERSGRAEEPREPRRWSARKVTDETPQEGRKAEADVEELIMISVLAPKGSPFTGPGLVETLRARGLRYGDMNIFHRVDPMTRATLYSVANVVEPGTFDLADLDEFRSPGVCFFMQLPGPEQPMDAFEDMLKVARDVAVRMGGELRDEKRSVMTGQTVEHYRQRISDFCRRRMSKRA
ncbi:MAG: cell division protein ZipA [Gammaproteobacteria bacterium]|nr:cell division protein ZipA [Gammaproteobacteria bacterium]